MSTYVAHIVEQIQHNVNFLVEQGEMSQQDADLVLSRLPTGEPVPSTAAIPVARVVPASAASTVGRRGIPPPPLARLSQAKAVWGYNENEEVWHLFNIIITGLICASRTRMTCLSALATL